MTQMAQLNSKRKKCSISYHSMKFLVSYLQNQVPLISSDGIHQLHIFIFVLAVTHVLYSITTMALGRLKVISTPDLSSKTHESIHFTHQTTKNTTQMRRWKNWEEETTTAEYRFAHGN